MVSLFDGMLSHILQQYCMFITVVKGVTKMFKKDKAELDLGYHRKHVYSKCYTSAAKMLSKKKVVSKKIQQAKKIFERLKNFPRLEKLSNNIVVFCDLLSDYLDGTYPNLPLATIVTVLASLLYLILPIDVIPDFAPFVGYLDDASVLAFVYNAVQNDITEYLEWKRNITE